MADELTYEELKAIAIAEGVPEDDIPEKVKEQPDDVAEIEEIEYE